MSAQGSPGGENSRPPTCYNCGADDHFMMACPEPTRQVPAGLAAARAAQASRSLYEQQQPIPDNRPFKRQKTGPVVTRYPLPNNGPAVTRYNPPVHQNAAYGLAAGPYPTPQQHQQSYAQQGAYGAPQQSGQQIVYQPPVNYGPYNQPPQGQAYYQPAQGAGPPYVPQPPTAQPRYNYPSSSPQPSYGPSVPDPQHVYSYQGSSEAMSTYGPAGPHPQAHGPGSYNYQPGPYGHMPPVYHQGSNQITRGWNQQHNLSGFSGPPHAQPPTFQQRSHQNFQKPFQQKRQSSYRGPQNRPYLKPQLETSAGGHPHADPQQCSVPQTPQDARSSVHLSSPEEGDAHASKGGGGSDLDWEWDMEKLFVEIKRRAADAIAHPLPHIFTEDLILPPAYNATQLTCKYVRPGNIEIFTLPIEQSLHWATLRYDPVFKKIESGSTNVSLDDLEMWIKYPQGKTTRANTSYDAPHETVSRKRARSSDEPDGGYNEGYSEQSFIDTAIVAYRSSSSPNTHHIPTRSRSHTPLLSRQMTPAIDIDDDAWAPQPGEGLISTSSHGDSTEELLASLGVSGAPKPVASKHPPLHVSTSPGSHVSHSDPNRDYRKDRQDSGYVSARGSYSNGSGSENNSSRGEYREQWIEHVPPPPPPPPRRYEGPFDSPASDASFRPMQDRILGGEPVPTQGDSPLTPTSAELLGQKPSYPYDKAVSRKPEPLRQVDDVTPKLKRRQPKVDEAYSRRW